MPTSISHPTFRLPSIVGMGDAGEIMISYAFVDGFTRVAREEAIERLKHAIADADGVIVDFAFFGWQAIRLTVELDAGALAVLQRALEAAEIEVFPQCAAELEGAKTMDATHPILAMLHVAFVPAEAEAAVGAHSAS